MTSLEFNRKKESADASARIYKREWGHFNESYMQYFDDGI